MTSGMSRPRAATSVAIRIALEFFLNVEIAELRSRWSFSPWMDTIVAATPPPSASPPPRPQLTSTILQRLSHSALVDTNTRHRPNGERIGSISTSHWTFAEWEGRTMTWLSTCSDEAPVWPMAILLRQASCRVHTDESDAETEAKEVQRTNTMARGLRWITNAGVWERSSIPKIISPTYPTSLAEKALTSLDCATNSSPLSPPSSRTWQTAATSDDRDGRSPLSN